MLITKKKLLTQERKHKQSFMALILIRLVKLNELSSTLLHNFSTWTFMKEVVVGGLIRRHPAGQPAKAYMFYGMGLGQHSENCSPCRTCLLWPTRWLIRRSTGRKSLFDISKHGFKFENVCACLSYRQTRNNKTKFNNILLYMIIGVFQ